MGIKQRVLRVEVSLTPKQEARQTASRMNSFPRFIEAWDGQEIMYFQDEAVFSSGQFNPKVWFSPQKQPIFIPKKKQSFKAIAVAAAIDTEGKVVAKYV